MKWSSIRTLEIELNTRVFRPAQTHPILGPEMPLLSRSALKKKLSHRWRGHHDILLPWLLTGHGSALPSSMGSSSSLRGWTSLRRDGCFRLAWTRFNWPSPPPPHRPNIGAPFIQYQAWTRREIQLSLVVFQKLLQRYLLRVGMYVTVPNGEQCYNIYFKGVFQ